MHILHIDIYLYNLTKEDYMNIETLWNGVIEAVTSGNREISIRVDTYADALQYATEYIKLPFFDGAVSFNMDTLTDTEEEVVDKIMQYIFIGLLRKDYNLEEVLKILYLTILYTDVKPNVWCITKEQAQLLYFKKRNLAMSGSSSIQNQYSGDTRHILLFVKEYMKLADAIIGKLDSDIATTEIIYNTIVQLRLVVPWFVLGKANLLSSEAKRYFNKTMEDILASY
jgi:hypothetical protein